MSNPEDGAALRQELSRLWGLAVYYGKVPRDDDQRFRTDSLTEIRRIGDGKITSKGVEWLRDKIEAMPLPPRSPPADWRRWKLTNKCHLWEAIVLSMGFDPSGFKGRDDGTERGALNIQTWTTLSAADLDELGRRLDVALSHLGDGIDDLTPMATGGRLNTTVSLPQFGGWTSTIWPDDLPPELPGRPPKRTPDVSPLATGPWPWGQYETDLLRVMAMAGREFFGPGKPKPSKKEVAAWLSENGVGAGRTANMIAQILCGK